MTKNLNNLTEEQINDLEMNRLKAMIPDDKPHMADEREKEA
jgi:hypothetical protein